jgi:gliding motility-associated-like protein
MYIYNRWGQLVFETDTILEGWDGTQNGNPCNMGVYVWVVYYEGENGKVTNKGSLTLIR